ncbi:peptidoglycan-recognition protein 2-like [Trichogramma pretiosum]|uniref:peptidoglycan-recognition protein 2-like n=1 Tax=Trichogramma pretiosum TaxID=7493 RepID=UPI0006C9A208|nr:peptidoglycan-recognition protein 2-like [Trichogramma pretiosum]
MFHVLLINFIITSAFVNDAQEIVCSEKSTECTKSESEESRACPRIINREGWEARQALSSTLMPERPVRYVVVHHGGVPRYCYNRSSCSAILRSYQDYHLDNNHWSDIGYQFVIGEDGNVYQGRGWDKVGAHAPGYNNRSIGICVIGDFTERLPNALALTALHKLIECGIAMKKLRTDYRVIGHRQARNTQCPGNAFYQYVRKMPNWMNSPDLLLSN